MEKRFTRFICFLAICLAPSWILSQSIDTLAYQNFEINPAAPTWTYTGTPAGFSAGFSSSNATSPNSPIGVDGSRAWQVFSVSNGNPLTFANQIIPSGYDSIKVSFRLAAMNLNGAFGGGRILPRAEPKSFIYPVPNLSFSPPTLGYCSRTASVLWKSPFPAPLPNCHSGSHPVRVHRVTTGSWTTLS